MHDLWRKSQVLAVESEGGGGKGGGQEGPKSGVTETRHQDLAVTGVKRGGLELLVDGGPGEDVPHLPGFLLLCRGWTHKEGQGPILLRGGQSRTLS